VKQMRGTVLIAGALAPALLAAAPVSAQQLIWGVQAEQLEYRAGEGPDILAWDADAIVGTDELKLRLRSEGEYALEENTVETLENQVRIETPVSDFFDLAVGARASTPAGPDRYHGVIGLHGLAPQWFEIDADLFVSDEPFFRVDAEYEALITNRVVLVPSVEVDLPLTDDPEIGAGAWGPKLEVGARISYDLVDRAVSPYVGVHYERAFGESALLASREGEDPGTVLFVVGTRILF